MNVWNKVLLVLIFLTAVFYVVLVANRFNLGKEWEEKLVALDKTIQSETNAIEKLKLDLYGDPIKPVEDWASMGLVAKMSKLDSLFPGKIWTNCGFVDATNLGTTEVEGMDAPPISITVRIPSGVTIRQYGDLRLTTDAPIYVFDSGAAPALAPSTDENQERGETSVQPLEKSVFLGIFTVENIDLETGEVKMDSVGVVRNDQRQSIQNAIDSGHGLNLCIDRLPIDSPNDLAYWLEKEPDSPFAKTFNENNPQDVANKAYFLLKSADFDQVNLSRDLISQGQSNSEELLRHLLETPLPEGTRLAVSYEPILTRLFMERNEKEVRVARMEKSIDNLNHVIGDQLAMIGLDQIPDQIKNLVGDEATTLLAGILQEAKRRYSAKTFIQLKEEKTIELAEMEKQRDLVKNRLEITVDCVKKLNERINALLQENAHLAQEIAKAMFDASDRVIQKSQDVTASVDSVDSVMNNPFPLQFEN